MRTDAIVLGAGIIGVSTALHLQARGRSVCIIDKGEPGEGTSFGNAGLIERSSVIPYSFPRAISVLAKYAFNRSTDVRYDPLFLPKVAPWLFRYWFESSSKRLASATEAMLPLVEASVHEHDALIVQAGCQHLIREKGWIETFHSPKALETAVSAIDDLQHYNLGVSVLDSAALHALEPNLSPGAIGGIHWLDPKSVTNPGGLVKAYAGLFESRGGKIVKGDAATLRKSGNDWQVLTLNGPVTARDVVLALGPQAAEVYKPFGYHIPLGIKRGYHMHYETTEKNALTHSLVDAQYGYVLSPMDRGIRLTTGIEFASPSAAINSIQLERAEKQARKWLPLGKRLDPQPWLGRRPCLPDMKPVIGPATRHPNLWFNFGHAHHGLTIGPACGRMLAEMITGAKPFVDPSPYSVARFGN